MTVPNCSCAHCLSHQLVRDVEKRLGKAKVFLRLGGQFAVLQISGESRYPPCYNSPSTSTSAQNEEARDQRLSQSFLLRPNVIFLNHASFGTCPRPVFEEYQRRQFELEQQPVEFLGPRFNDLMQGARTALAEYVNADPDELVCVPNATTGLNIVARSLGLRPGDEVLGSDHEYGALERTLNFLCRETGATFTQEAIPVPLTTRDEFVDRFRAGVTPRTRVIFLSHITSPTALIFPVEEICSRARAAGILTIIDGAHVLGQIPLDVSNLGCDFYCSNAHKWMQSPKGSAFLYARREMQHLFAV